MNLIGFLLTPLAAVVVVTTARRWAALGLIGSVCYITQGQTLDLGGFNFYAVRIVLLAGFIRVVARGELRKLQLINIDWVVLAYAIFSMLMAGLRMGVWQESVGTAYNTLLSYFVFRCLVTSWKEAQEFFLGMAIFIIPMALCMLWESRTGKNVFEGMGGYDMVISREGRLRCVGAFRGPHTAGTFGATWIPLFASLYFTHVHRRRIVVVGMIAATIITYTSNSSGPLMAYLSGLVALAFWPLRKDMKKVRWAIVAFLVVMAIVMKAPIWYIMAKISEITGGDGWYRSYLMEQCFNHISDWWLMGTSDTSQWGATLLGWGGADLCNVYVACAASAGLGSLVLFVLILVRCFQNLGRALNMAREILPESEGLLWCVGSAPFAHVMTLTSVTYWDQMQVAWWAFVAIIPGVTSSILKIEPVSATAVEVEQVAHHAEATS